MGTQRHSAWRWLILVAIAAAPACAAKGLKGTATLGPATTASVGSPAADADAARDRVRSAVRALKDRLQEEKRASASTRANATPAPAAVATDTHPVGTAGTVAIPLPPAADDVTSAPGATTPVGSAGQDAPCTAGSASSPARPRPRVALWLALAAAGVFALAVVLLRR